MKSIISRIFKRKKTYSEEEVQKNNNGLIPHGIFGL